MAEEKARLNEAAIDWKVDTSPKGRYESHNKFLSHELTAAAREQPTFFWREDEHAPVRRRPFEVDLVKLPPGKWNCPRHYHSEQWEYYMVLSGHGEMLQEKGTPSIPMEPGDHIVQPPGWIHTVANTGDEDLVYYVIADNPDDEHCYYPDSDKWLAADTIFRMQKVDYFDGEE
ncbi:MAG: cupin domain-containing protein [Thermaerobacter sp.]|nr:cupin domain-containing protein [Thermaerobacter sp.]